MSKGDIERVTTEIHTETFPLAKYQNGDIAKI